MDDDEGESETPKDGPLPADHEEPPTTSEPHPGRWFATAEPVPELPRPSTSSVPLPPRESTQTNGEEDEEEQPIRLVPLASSTLPSISDFLAMDKAAGEQNKWRKRKDKKGGGAGGGEDKAKVDRDYKRLKSYTEKKAAASTSK